MPPAGTPKYTLVATALEERIRSGSLKPDTPLPTIRELMIEFRFSLATITRAIEIVERRGLITRIHGKGIFVNGPMFTRANPKPGGAAVAAAPARSEADAPSLLAQLSIGVLCQFPNSDRPAEMWWSRILRGVDAALAAGAVENARMRLVPMKHKMPETIISKCASDGINALLLLGGMWEKEHVASIYRAVRQHRMPAVMMWTGTPRPLCVNSVDVDNRSGIYAAVEYLVKLGHTHLVFLGFSEKLNWVEERRRAYREIAALLQVPKVSEIDVPMLATARRKKDLCHHVLSAGTGVVTVNDDAAVWLLNTASDAGRTAPADFSVIGFDDDPAYRHLELTTIHVDMEQLGLEAGRLLGRMAAEQSSGPIYHLNLPTNLVVRHTTGPVGKRRG